MRPCFAPVMRTVCLTVSVVLLISASPTTAWSQDSLPSSSPITALKINTGTQKVPAGTMLKIMFNTAMDARITEAGEPFTAFIEKDFATKPLSSALERVILPKGTMVRGRIEEVRKPRFFSRGGTIRLSFDHVVLPSGDLLPLDLNLSARNDQVKRIRSAGESVEQYALYTDPGVGHKIHKGLESGVSTFNKIRKSGVDAGKDVAGGAGMILTVPAAVVGGAFAGGAVGTGKGVKAVFGRGDSVIIQPGDSVNIDFGGAFSLPTE